MVLITRDDMIRSGVCEDRVDEWIRRHADGMTAIDSHDAMAVSTGLERYFIRRAIWPRANYGGNGDGDGYCGANYGDYGDGHGDGYGGNGDGYCGANYGGNGDGDGYGYGDGCYGDGCYNYDDDCDF